MPHINQYKMKEARFFYVPQAPNTNQLPPEEAIHATRVLRLKEGDDIFIIDGKGTFYDAIVNLSHPKRCSFTVQNVTFQNRVWQSRIHIGIAPTKNIDRIEWLAEKATEIGFDEMSLLNCRFSERTTVKTERIEKIIISAMKQSRKAWKPLLNPVTPFEEFINTPRKGQKFIAHCYEEIPKEDLFVEMKAMKNAEDVTILIGPEGDFSTDEVRLAIEKGYKSVSLGSSRLRTETAGLMAVAMAQLVLRK